MQVAPKSESPAVLTYLALRKTVGIVAVGLPFALAIPWWIVHHMLQGAISDYYRNEEPIRWEFVCHSDVPTGMPRL